MAKPKEWEPTCELRWLVKRPTTWGYCFTLEQLWKRGKEREWRRVAIVEEEKAGKGLPDPSDHVTRER